MAIPSTSLAHDTIVRESWARCRQFGLSHQSRPVFDPLPHERVTQLLDANQALVHTTHQQVLPFYENILSNSNCLILLADHQGHVLTSWGTQRFVDAEHKFGFIAGASWLEQGAGTNAIGTALACEQAVHIEHDEHFLKANRFMTGSAAPIFDAERQVIAVLDVSSDSFLPPSHTLGMVKMMGQTVENRLILDRFEASHFQLIFNTGLNNLDSQWAGLLMIDDMGRIRCANRRADTLLGTVPTGSHVESLFSGSLERLLQQPEGQPFALLAAGQNRFHCLLRRPKAAVTYLHVVPGKRPLSASPSPVAEGDERVTTASRQALKMLEKNIPLLVTGETGVGKELFVKALHNASSRAAQPFIAVNCAAIPSELVEAELFGYEKGAFTGANHKGSVGLIRKADGGTLFLDEIGDMPLAVQARLLRVLQERSVQPVGGGEASAVDIRVVSATHCSLRDLVQEGRFRQDLYYRVSGLSVELPPLRERSDRRDLARSLWEQHREPQQGAGFSAEVLELFDAHPWPGNLRQMSTVIQVALALADEQPIGPEHLPGDFFIDLENSDQTPVSTIPFGRRAIPESAEALNDLLQANGGNISQLAKQLGVSRNTLYKRLREL